MSTKTVYKVWVDIEECEVDENGDVVESRGDVDIMTACTGTFDDVEDAIGLAERINETFEQPD